MFINAQVLMTLKFLHNVSCNLHYKTGYIGSGQKGMFKNRLSTDALQFLTTCSLVTSEARDHF